AGSGVPTASRPSAGSAGRVDDLSVVDCLLPGRVQKLGQRLTYLTPRQAVKTTAQDCEIRGGEYTAYDRRNYATALKIWVPQAEAGDKVAQTYVGEIYEKGVGARLIMRLPPPGTARPQSKATPGPRSISPTCTRSARGLRKIQQQRSVCIGRPLA